MYGPTLDINIDLCENNGKMAASNLLNINVKTLQGSGSLAGSVTNIACDNYYLAGSVSAAKNVILEQKYLSQVEQLIRAALA